MHDWTKEEFSKQGIPLSCFENRQCRQRLVKRRTGEARTVWAAIRRRCQFKRYNRQRKQQEVTRSTAPVVPRGLRKTSVVNFHFTPFSFFKIDNASSKRSREAPHLWCRVGCEKRVLSIFDKYTREEIGISQAALNNYFSKLGESDEPIYKNKKCTIRKGTLYVKPTTRGRKKQND